MLTLYKVLLAPALVLQGSRLRKTALRLPEAAGDRSGHIHGNGAQPLRLLFTGDSSAAGVGVDWQHEALAQQAAQLVAARSGRSVQWTLIAQSGANTRDAIELIKAQANGPADVLISALGVNDVTSQTSARRFVRDYNELLTVVAQRTGARAAVISGLPPAAQTAGCAATPAVVPGAVRQAPGRSAATVQRPAAGYAIRIAGLGQAERNGPRQVSPRKNPVPAMGERGG
jgi:lysophospholipase L1-like esterase